MKAGAIQPEHPASRNFRERAQAFLATHTARMLARTMLIAHPEIALDLLLLWDDAAAESKLVEFRLAFWTKAHQVYGKSLALPTQADLEAQREQAIANGMPPSGRKA